MQIATSPTPSANSRRPNVKRTTPVFTSVPQTPHSMPTSVIAIPFRGEPPLMVAPAISPSIITEKMSPGVNLNASFTRIGEKKIITRMPTDAAKNDASMVMPNAAPPRPCLVMG